MNFAGPRREPVKVVPVWVRIGAPPPPRVAEIEVEDANPPWNARERTLIKKMES